VILIVRIKIPQKKCQTGRIFSRNIRSIYILHFLILVLAGVTDVLTVVGIKPGHRLLGRVEGQPLMSMPREIEKGKRPGAPPGGAKGGK
jgi:hypothetical protein